MLVVRALLWFVLGEVMWGREAKPLAWNGPGMFGCSKFSQNMEVIETYARAGVCNLLW